MNKAEAKAVVTIPMKGRYFLHKNGGIIPVTDLINAIYLMTGDEKLTNGIRILSSIFVHSLGTL